MVFVGIWASPGDCNCSVPASVTASTGTVCPCKIFLFWFRKRITICSAIIYLAESHCSRLCYFLWEKWSKCKGAWLYFAVLNKLFRHQITVKCFYFFFFSVLWGVLHSLQKNRRFSKMSNSKFCFRMYFTPWYFII